MYTATRLILKEKAMKQVVRFYNSNLALWVTLFAGVAFFYPDLFLIFKHSINFFFAATMFGIGLVLTSEDYRAAATTPVQVLLGNVFQFSIMPVLGFLIAMVFNLPEAFAVGLILTGAAPGAMTSNVLSFLSDGDVAYSVSLTAVATLLAPVLTPLLTLALAGRMVPVPFFDMFLTIIYTVVVPLILGFAVRYFFPRQVDSLAELPPALSVTAIIIITSYVVAANRDTLAVVTITLFLAVAVHNLLGMVMGYFAGKISGFSFKRRKTLSIEIGMQNAGLGVILALNHFSAEVAVPAAIFTIWCIITASIMVSFWKVLEKRIS